MLEIFLNEQQHEYCKRIAVDRRNGKEQLWYEHGGVGMQMRQADYIGACVEYAFQWVHSVFHEAFNGKIFVGGDGGIDYATPAGTAIDVKGSKENSRWMLVPEHQIKRGGCDLYIMGRLIEESMSVRFDGWITTKDFKSIMQFRPFGGKHTGYGCWISSLQPIESFVNGLDRRLF